jgi:hypothetical protein
MIAAPPRQSSRAPFNRAGEMRESARQFRDYTAQTCRAKYVELMSRTASELERIADQMDGGRIAASPGETAACKASRIATELAALIAESRRNSRVSAL